MEALKTKETQYKISNDELLLSLKLLMEDNYVGNCRSENDTIRITFFNGQVFQIKIEEVA